MNLDKVVRRAGASGIAVDELRRFCSEAPARPGLVIGYGAIPTSKIDEGLRRLVASFG